MEKLAVIYWSQTGNTQAMAEAVLEGARAGGADAQIFTVSEITADQAAALFGSYGWGDGQWMRDWQDRVTGAGAQLFNGEGLMINETPDDSGLADCRALGSGLAGF